MKNRYQQCPLCLAPLGKDLKVLHLNSNKSTEVRLIGMGIMPGSLIKLKETSDCGIGCVVALNDCRLAISSSIARKIIVETIESV